MGTVILVAIYLFCSVGGLVLVKLGTSHNQFSAASSFFSLSLSYTTLIGLFLYIISFLMWMIIVQKFDLSYIQPIAVGLSYILIIGASLLIFKETISMNQWIGLGCILVGIVLMNLQK